MPGLIFIVALIVMGDLLLKDKKAHTQNRRFFCIITFGMMFLFAALRSTAVGIDTVHRYDHFVMLIDLDWKGFTKHLASLTDEYGQDTFVWLFTRIFPSPYLVEIIMNGFIIWSFACFFYRYSEDISISALMFFAFFFGASLNITRQYVAGSLFLWVIHFLVKKKPAKSIILVLLAVSFHSSAVVLFAFYALYLIRFQLSRKKLLLFAGGALGAFVFFDIIIEFVIAKIFPQYWWYVTGDWAVGNVQFSFLWLVIYSGLIFLLYLQLPKGKEEKKKKKEKIKLKKANAAIGASQRVYCISVVAFVLYVLTSMLTSKIWFLSRMNTYFSFGYAMSAAYIFAKLPHIEKKSAKAIRQIFMLGLAAWAILMYAQDGHGLLPYTFIWD